MFFVPCAQHQRKICSESEDSKQGLAFISSDKAGEEHLCAFGVLSRGYAPCSAAHRACPALIPLGLNYTRHSGPKCAPDGSIGGAGAKICDPFCRFVPRCAVMRRESKRAAEAFSAPHCPLVGALQDELSSTLFDRWTSALHLIRNLSLSSGCSALSDQGASPRCSYRKIGLLLCNPRCANSIVFSAA